MKTLYLLAFLVVGLMGRVVADEAPPASWSIVKNSPLFSLSAEFDCKCNNVVEAKVIRTGAFCPRYYYDLYNPNNEHLARGITRFLSWGFLFPSQIEIDVWDENRYIGKIDGQFWTKARAKFVFTDAIGTETISAFVNSEAADFVIVSAKEEAVKLADFSGKSYGDVSVWEMNFTKQLKVDPRLLKIFAAFVSDYHNSFLPPPKEINNYSYYFAPSYRYE